MIELCLFILFTAAIGAAMVIAFVKVVEILQ